MRTQLEEQKKELVLRYNEKNRIGWFLELPATLILIFMFTVLGISFKNQEVSLILFSIFFSINIIYLNGHLIYFILAYINHSNALGKIDVELNTMNSISFQVVNKHDQSPDHFQKCPYCGYDTPNQFKKCSHCGAVL